MIYRNDFKNKELNSSTLKDLEKSLKSKIKYKSYYINFKLINSVIVDLYFKILCIKVGHAV